jgi:hypothetical protein
VRGVHLFPHDNVCTYAFLVYRSANAPVGSDLTIKTDLLKDGKPTKKYQWLPLSGAKDPGMYELGVRVRDAGSNRIAQRTAVIGIE